MLRCDPPKAERNPQDDYLPLGELLPQADIVTCHVPLNRTGNYPTLQNGSASFFEAIKPGAIFINTSGKIVDDEALIGALQSGRLSHAVVDTWNNEPDIHPTLLSLATFATPHIAGYSIQGKAAGTAAASHEPSANFRIPLNGWYPPQVTPSRADPKNITWERMRETMPRYFRIEAETQRLRSAPSRIRKHPQQLRLPHRVLLNDPIHNENVADDVLFARNCFRNARYFKIIPTFAEILAA